MTRNNPSSPPPLPRLKKHSFPTPKELREPSAPIRVSDIAIDEDYFSIHLFGKDGKPKVVQSAIKGEKDRDIHALRGLLESNLSVIYDDGAAIANCINKLVETVDKLYTKDAVDEINKIRKHRKAEDARFEMYGDGEGGEFNLTAAGEQNPVYVVKKFTGATIDHPKGIGLAEAVLVGGKPCFAYLDRERAMNLELSDELETEDMKLRPPARHEYPPDSAYEFEDKKDLEMHIEAARDNDSIYRQYRDIKRLYSKEYFVDTDWQNSSLLAMFTITSYFQDKFSTVPYIWLIGENGSGKGSIILTYTSLGYRVFYMSGASGANICDYLGTIEDGTGCVAEDELDSLDKDDYKKLIYKNGYQKGASVPKILDASSKSRTQQYYRSYCQKMAASEKLPTMEYSRGVIDRLLGIIRCVKGFPKYNIKEIRASTNTPEEVELINMMQTMKKRLFAYRLLHYHDVIPKIEGLNISGRALELTNSALRLFYTYRNPEGKDDRTFEREILLVLSGFLRERLGRRNDSLEGRLYEIVSGMVEAHGGKLEFDTDTIFYKAMSDLEGEPIPHKVGAFYVEDKQTLQLPKEAKLDELLEHL